MKKFFSILFGFVMALCFAGLVGCGGQESKDPVHGFVGQFSEESFEKEEDAVEALEDEFSGKAFSIKLVKYMRDDKLSKSALRNMNTKCLKTSEKLVAGRKVVVTYEKKDAREEESAQGTEMTFTAKVCDIETPAGLRYKYYIDRADYNGMIAKSYFEYLLASPTVVNYTYTTETKMVVSVGGESESMSVTTEYRVNEDKAHIYITEQDKKSEIYLERRDDSVKVWQKDAGSDQFLPAISDIVNEYKDFFGTQPSEEELEFMDWSCFISSDTGIVMNVGGREFLIQKLTQELAGDLGGAGNMLSFDGDVSFHIDTEDGLPKEMHITAELSAWILNINIKESATADAAFSDIGTTVVETPEGLS